MIRFERVTIGYRDGVPPVLADVDLAVGEGELCLVVGTTGVGKSTLLGAVNGLVPRFSGGRLDGRVQVAGRDTRTHDPRALADVVGYVPQDPARGFVADTVEQELAYVMENLGVAPEVMRRRVEDTLDLLGLHELRDRPLATLSGGQAQRVAIGSVLTTGPSVLVLDEPTSALDPAAAEEVLAALTRLVHDVGTTVLMAEHRLERVVQYADRVAVVAGDAGVAGGAGTGGVRAGDPARLLAGAPVVPPIVALGRLAGWDPLPLSVRDARRQAAELRARLAGRQPDERRPTPGEPIAVARDVRAGYGPLTVLRSVDLSVGRGEVIAVMGRNGSGKSTLLAQLAGLRRPWSGMIEVAGRPVHDLDARDVIRHVGMVPQDPALLLYHDTVAEECRAADRDAGLREGTTASVLERLIGGVPAGSHPRDLSEGQRLALVLAVVLAPAPPLLLLDEPTRGLDYPAKHRLGEQLRELAREGHGVVLATHDVEVVAEVADRVIVLGDGEVVADGPARDVVCHSPVFAPQVAKVLAPEPWLTVGEVERALAGAP